MLPWLIGGALAIGSVIVLAISDDDDNDINNYKIDVIEKAKKSHNEKIYNEISKYLKQEIQKLGSKYNIKLDEYLHISKNMEVKFNGLNTYNITNKNNKILQEIKKLKRMKSEIKYNSIL